MQIKEVEDKLNISSYTLRYYEKMGLVKPYRDHNGYRNYNDDDIKILKKVRFLRELEIPIEDIQDIIEEKTTFQNVLDRHMKKIDIQMKSLQYVKDTCKQLKEKELPLLETLIDDKGHDELIDQENTKSCIKTIFDYLKPIKTVVIGYRVSLRDYLSFMPTGLFISIIFGFAIAIGIPNLIGIINNQFKDSPRSLQIPIYNASPLGIIIATIIIFIIIVILMALYDSKQNYIELLDNHISICDYHNQKRLSILKSMLIRKESPYNKQYQWSELNHVKIKLYFEKTSSGRAGVWTIYVPVFTFYFNDGFAYEISSGISFGEDSQTAYQILRNKNIEIYASDEIIDYFEQNELKGYDYFEKIYHKNSKKC